MEDSTEYGHEQSDLNPAKIVLFGAILLGVVAASAAAGFLFLRYAPLRYPAPRVLPEPPARAVESPTPRLQVKGANELKEMREAEDNILRSYAWVDREKESCAFQSSGRWKYWRKKKVKRKKAKIKSKEVGRSLCVNRRVR
jgi:hypothetical protein